MSRQAADIHTSRLILRATTVEHLHCELESPERLSSLLGVDVPASWPPGFYDADAMRFFLEKLLQEGDEAVGWYGWYAIHLSRESDNGVLVASAGYVGPPNDGVVEIGYSVVPEERGKGYASEVVVALTARALESAIVRSVVAEVHETNGPSMRVLEKCGFVKVGPGRDAGHWRYRFRGMNDVSRPK